MDLDLLRTLVAVTGSPTLTAAASRLRVTKSAVSQQMKALESRMGVPLFERVGRGLRPTPAAAALVAALRPAFAQVDAAIEAAREAHAAVRGEVALGAPRPFTQTNLAPVFAELLATHRELLLEVAFGTPTELEAMLLDGTIDLAVLARPPESDAIASEPLFVETFELVASPRYVQRHGKPRTAEELAQHRFIVFDRDEPMHRAWLRATFGARAERTRCPVIARVANVETMLALVGHGAAMAVLPDYLLPVGLVRVEIRTAKRPARNTIVLAWRRALAEPARVRVVRAALLGRR